MEDIPYFHVIENDTHQIRFISLGNLIEFFSANNHNTVVIQLN
jgi:hypothetical protein